MLFLIQFRWMFLNLMSFRFNIPVSSASLAFIALFLKAKPRPVCVYLEFISVMCNLFVTNFLAMFTGISGAIE